MTFVLNTIDKSIIQIALKEDLLASSKDVTTDCFAQFKTIPYQLSLISKHNTPIVLAGLSLMKEIFNHLNFSVNIEFTCTDGDMVQPGGVIAVLTGEAAVLLFAERTILNFLRHLSGIATLTSQFVSAVSHTDLIILDTRKTTPGLRHLEKYAVTCGGGVNHRAGLYDAILLKDNHVDLVGGMSQALAHLPLLSTHDLPVIVEVRDEAELKVVMQEGIGKITRVLLDNMTLTQIKTCAKLAREQYETEASGDITLRNIKAIAETGVQYASVGALTHSAGQVDLSMQKEQE